jgi:hypothetical protein
LGLGHQRETHRSILAVGVGVCGGSHRGSHRLRIEPTTHQERPKALKSLGVIRQWTPTQVPGEGNASSRLLGYRQLLGIFSARCVHLDRSKFLPHKLDHVPPNPVLAQFGLHHAMAPGGVSIALLQPPAGERQVINEAKAGEMFEGGRDDSIARMRAPQASFDLPAAAWPRAEEPGRNLQ